MPTVQGPGVGKGGLILNGRCGYLTRKLPFLATGGLVDLYGWILRSEGNWQHNYVTSSTRD